ncbi:hypothetical protein I2483_13630 [Sporosarcina sp. E16_3]|uniref:hypothetical protein n=1 Tax=Sporosarcina sp. E16_3 TaxID=2789293 RepID=UPI001A90F16E|nr:hypothetical protein [Sporosarcina sp. E16_3]MBO0602703.1 hypothetical protein [Sporosarcina sp. E16_3]
MAKVLTTQADMDAVFRKMERDYGALTKKQQAYAIKEIGRIRGETAEMLADFADTDGVIKQQRTARLLRELDVIEASLRSNGTIVLEGIIGDSSEWTTRAITAGMGVTLSATQFDRINKHVVRYAVERFGEDGLVLSDRVWGLSGGIRDELSTVIRTGIIRGDGINAMIPKIRKVYDNETWKIRRLARNESVTAHRAAIGYNAQESGLVKWVQFHAGVKKSKPCVALSEEDRYGKGTGIFSPVDTDLWMPHVNCTGYSSYVLDERWL